MTRKIQRYGRKVDLPDPRDRIYNSEEHILNSAQVPVKRDLTPKMPPIYDQGQLGSCTGNGWARVMEYMEISQGEGAVTPSRLFIYYNERAIEGTVDQDSGAEVRTGAKVVSSLGSPPETDWPYDIAQFAVRPSSRAYDDARKHEALVYQRIIVGTPGCPMRTAISRGLPIVFGFSVPDYFEDPNWDVANNPLPLPDASTQIIGGHCVVVTAYDFSCTKFPIPVFKCDNSWGPGWGAEGRFWMDYRWFTPDYGLANDLWVVQKVS